MEKGIILIVLTIILATFYVSVSSIGIGIYDKCNQLKTSEKWKNIRKILSHTLVIAMTIPGVLFTRYLVGDDKLMGGMGILYGILGIIGSSIAYALYNESACKEHTKESQGNYLIGAIVGSVITTIGSGFLVR